VRIGRLIVVQRGERPQLPDSVLRALLDEIEEATTDPAILWVAVNPPDLRPEIERWRRPEENPVMSPWLLVA
jgi:hypothetical protein